jgi:predicted aspartyl protease
VNRDASVRPALSGEGIQLDRRTLAFALAGLALPGAALAQAAPTQPPRSEPPIGTRVPPQGASTPGTAPAAEEPETVELESDVGRRMTARVTLNGKGPYSFVVDTGANSTVVATEVAVALGLPAGPPARVHGIASAVETQTARVEQFRFGNYQRSLPEAPLLPAAALGADGILGIDVLADRQVTMDFVTETLLVDRPGGGEWSAAGFANTDVRVGARQRAGQLTLVDARAAGARMTCFIDTGAQRTVGNLALQRAIRGRHADRDFNPIKVLIRGATGQVVEGVVDYVPDMKIGGVNFTRFAMAFADLHTFQLWNLTEEPAIMLGMDILRIFDAVSIDFAGREVTFRVSTGARNRGHAGF